MTLLIACLQLSMMNVTDPLPYIGAGVLWCIHVLVHC